MSIPKGIGGTERLERAGFKAGVEVEDLWDAFGQDEESVEVGDGSSAGVEQSLSAFFGDEKYAVHGEMAKGGMGQILQGIDRDLRRPVAMKVMLNRADEECRARFVEEAQITGQLEHPNIVPIHELGIDGEGHLFFTMKMVRGRCLAEILDDLRENGARGESRYSVESLLHALIQVCNGLEYAHSRGVVHRDIKPANIMIGDYGEVLVLDWGLAKIGATRAARRKEAVLQGMPYHEPTCPPPEISVREASESQPWHSVHSYRHDSSLLITRDGTVAGTPAYMSPEQARGDLQRIDERSDVYGLGAVLYELLALTPPVQGRSDEEYLQRVKEGAVIPPEKRAPRRSVSPALSRIAMKALSYDPAERYDSVAAFRDALNDILERSRAERQVVGTSLRRSRIMNLVLVVVTATAAFGMGWLWRSLQASRQDLALCRQRNQVLRRSLQTTGEQPGRLDTLAAPPR